MPKFKLKKGDQVIALAGRSKGKIGEILKVNVSGRSLIVKGVNMVHKHERPSQTSKGGIIQKESFIHISNVALVDPLKGGATKVGFITDKSGVKKRYAKKSGEIIV